MKDYGRPLVLHWNERHMRRRQVIESTIREVGKTLEIPADADTVKIPHRAYGNLF